MEQQQQNFSNPIGQTTGQLKPPPFPQLPSKNQKYIFSGNIIHLQKVISFQ